MRGLGDQEEITVNEKSTLLEYSVTYKSKALTLLGHVTWKWEAALNVVNITARTSPWSSRPRIYCSSVPRMRFWSSNACGMVSACIYSELPRQTPRFRFVLSVPPDGTDLLAFFVQNLVRMDGYDKRNEA